jgi:hypothetical protein
MWLIRASARSFRLLKRSLRLLKRGRQKIVGSVFLVSADKNNKAFSGGNHIALLKGWISQGSVRGFHFLLSRCHRIFSSCPCIRDEFLRLATRILDALLPLLAAQRGPSEVIGLLSETV